ncbi:MAG: agmatinase family protein [Chloroflexi bacterium]|nr:agmatinase family protein [Chloroflexota bacterium]
MAVSLAAQTQTLLLPPVSMRATIPDAYETSMAELIRPYAPGLEAEVALLGVPFDTTTMVRRGSRLAPQAVRMALAGSSSFEPGLGVDLADGPALCDVGDVDVVHTSIDVTWERTRSVVGDLVRSGLSPLVIGGDHGAVYPVVSGVAEGLGHPVGVIVFDSHYDVRISHHGETSSGVPFRYLLEAEPAALRGENLVEIGLVGWHNARLYRDYCLERGVTLISAREVHRGRPDEIARRALEIAGAGTDAIWVSVDIDCVDAAFAPGTNVPAIGGLTSFEMLEMLNALGSDPRVVGMDVMEVSPPFDSAGNTAALAAALILNYLAGRQRSREP